MTTQYRDESLTVSPIGNVRRDGAKTVLAVFPAYIPALKQLEHFSHIHVIAWGAVANDTAILPNQSPPEDGVSGGMFASRTAVRPNPITLRTVRVLNVDHEEGLIEIAGIDAVENTPVLDIKAHFPAEDRVKNVTLPAQMTDWPKWLPEDGISGDLSENSTMQTKHAQQAHEFRISPIGIIRKQQGTTCLHLQENFAHGLDQLEQFSHLRLFWWFHRLQDDRFRRTTQCQPPYEGAPRTGVFASRSPVRPNPIGLTTAKIVDVDHVAGIVEITATDAFDKTPILDIQPYIPYYDRVQNFSMPTWVSHWTEWHPETDEIVIVNPKDLRPSDSERLAQRNVLFAPNTVDVTNSVRAKLVEASTKKPFGKLRANGDPLKSTVSRIGSETDAIVICGARKHNLRNINITIPRNSLTVITGVSGSGKSSLAFDTLYAEGQRRYMEGVSTLARQFLDQMEKPEVDHIFGLNPTIAIEQKTVSRNPRSTVGSITQVFDFLRLLFSRIGTRHCPQCGRAVQAQNARRIANQIAGLEAGTRIRIGGAGHDDESEEYIIPEERDEASRATLKNVVDTCLRAGNGILTIMLDDGDEFRLTEHNACPYCDRVFFELSSTLFSFNSPDGMCPDCHGLGQKLTVDPERIVADPTLSLLDGASLWWGKLRQSKRTGNWMRAEVLALAEHWKIDLELPWNQLPQKFRDAALYGAGDEKFSYTYEMGKSGRSGEIVRPVQGAVNHLTRLFSQSQGKGSMQTYLKFMTEQPCPTCQGERLCADARFVTVSGTRYPEVATMTVAQAKQWLTELSQHLADEQDTIADRHIIAGDLLAELDLRLCALLKVGLHYLALDRSAPSLSGGEGQRIRLATQLGCGLTGILYVLDEPSIGLHPRDHRPMLNTMCRLRDEGNTVVVVEHDADTMRMADYLIDIGPGAGTLGGHVVAAGTPNAVMDNPDSLTGRYLRGELSVTSPNGTTRRIPQDWLTLTGAALHNLQHVEARFPLGMLICVTGVSGSGKSSLIAHTLSPALAQKMHGIEAVPGAYDSLDGCEQLDKLITITQTPIGRTPRSNPGTYTGVFDEIRNVFAATPEARERSYKAGRFSFNSKGGRCEECQGDGKKRIEMHFMPDVWVTCTECHGQRFNSETLEIVYNGKTIADVLDMDVQEALEFFNGHPKITRMLHTLHDVGLEYIKIGQSAITLSGGEAQRVKLAKELSRMDTGRTLYILDEPTTGLHFADIQKLLDVLHRLTDAGNTVIIIEHNLDVIKTADWILDLGPEGGDEGGYLVAEGTPEDVVAVPESYTGQFLKPLLPCLEPVGTRAGV